MNEFAIRKKVCDEIERNMVLLLVRLANASPDQSAGLLGVSLGMQKVLRDARRTTPTSEVK